jgi:predicted amidohydrolase
LTVEQVLERATTTPARVFSYQPPLGTLREGAEADVSILRVTEGRFEFTDSAGRTRTGRHELESVAAVKAGRLYRRRDLDQLRLSAVSPAAAEGRTTRHCDCGSSHRRAIGT